MMDMETENDEQSEPTSDESDIKHIRRLIDAALTGTAIGAAIGMAYIAWRAIEYLLR